MSRRFGLKLLSAGWMKIPNQPTSSSSLFDDASRISRYSYKICNHSSEVGGGDRSASVRAAN
jgi:hypothetical protein